MYTINNHDPEIKAFNNKDKFYYFFCGVMFTSYLKKTLQETRKNFYFREKKYSSNMISLTYFTNDLTCQIDIEDMCIDVADKFESVQLYNSFNLLSKKQRDVIYRYYILEKSEVEISKNIGISKQAVNRTRKRALSTMIKNI